MRFCKDCKFCQREGHTYPPGISRGDWRGWLCTWLAEKFNPVTGAKEFDSTFSLCESERHDGTKCGPEGKQFEAIGPFISTLK